MHLFSAEAIFQECILQESRSDAKELPKSASRVFLFSIINVALGNHRD